VVGFTEHGNEPSDSINRGEIFDQLSDYWFSRMAVILGAVCHLHVP
jgi:hypothetical protein